MDLKKTCNTRSARTAARRLFQSLPAPSFKFSTSVAAVVDEDVVLESEVQRRLATIYAQIQSSPAPSLHPRRSWLQQVLERLISERLQLNMGYERRRSYH